MKPPLVGAHDLTGHHLQNGMLMDSQQRRLRRQQRKLDGLMKKKLKTESELVGGKNRKRKKILQETMI